MNQRQSQQPYHGVVHAVRTIATMTLLILTTILAGCKPTVPSQYIPQDQLEELLYDYHLADAIARQQKGDYNANLIALRAGVLKKHGVSQADFDSTMVYYMRHTQQLHTIYEHLSERMDRQSQQYGTSTALTRITTTGDTADVWKGPKSLTLIPNQPYNLHQFTLKPDTSFHKGDRVVMMFHTDFIFQDGSRNGLAFLAVVFSNDSVVTRNLHMSSSTSYNMQIDDNDSLGIKEVRGFFMLGKNNQANASSTTLHLMSVTDIHLLRCHVRPNKSASSAKNGQSGPQPDSPDQTPPEPVEADDNLPPTPKPGNLPPNAPLPGNLPQKVPLPQEPAKAINLDSAKARRFK